MQLEEQLETAELDVLVEPETLEIPIAQLDGEETQEEEKEEVEEEIGEEKPADDAEESEGQAG